jgi:phosphoribosylformylglycinamidine synthase I
LSTASPPPRIAVVVFPGSNCEHDTAAALSSAGAEATLVWHDVADLGGFDAAVLPGGFAHGDYLRPGAIARFSPVMSAVGRLAAAGAPVLGVCNGFQVLTEAGLLPGALAKNAGLRFVCETVSCTVVSPRSVLTGGLEAGEVLRLPINHYDGRFTCDPGELARLELSGRVVLRYVGDPNGSLGGVAAVANGDGNVVGCMPHPERASDPLLGCEDGRLLIASFVAAAAAHAGHPNAAHAGRPAATGHPSGGCGPDTPIVERTGTGTGVPAR